MTNPKYYVKKIQDITDDEVCCVDPDLSELDAISGALALNSGVINEEDAYCFYPKEAYPFAPTTHLVMVRKK